jgi:hypothetical protein
MNRLLIPVAALVMASASPAAATIVRPLTVEQMSQVAKVVVHGRVVDRSAAWNEARNRIYTVTRVEVLDSVKGPAKVGEQITIRQIGGTVDGITQSVVGDAKMRAQEEVFLFLDRDEAQPLHYMIGMAQGKFAIDRTGPIPAVVRDVKGLAFAQPGADGRQIISEKPPAAGELAPSLDRFKQRVRAALTR